MNDIERELRDLGERTAGEAAYREAPAARIVRRARIRRTLTVAAPALAVVLFAGVAIPRVDWPGEGGGGSTIATLADAIDTTEDAGTARVDVEFEFEMGAEVISSSATGVTDFETGRSLLDVTYSQNGEDRAVETVTDGRRVFERPADSTDGKWREADLPPGAAVGTPGSEPDELLAYLESLASEITRVGSDVRDGEPVTHYRAILDPAKVEAAAPQAPPEDLEAEYAPTEIWIDQQGRLREATFAGTVTMDDFEQTIRGRIHLYDFGVEVDIELPGPDEITDEPPITSDFGSSGSAGESEDFDEFGVGELFTVAGDEGLSGPHAIVTISDESVAVCIQHAPPATIRSTLVEVGSGEVVMSVRDEETETNGAALGGCKLRGLSTDLADDLRDHRESYELRFERSQRPEVVVPLTHTF
jgi:hypothetical protein